MKDLSLFKFRNSFLALMLNRENGKKGISLSIAFVLLFASPSFCQYQSPILDTASLTSLEMLAGKNPDSLSYQMAYIKAFVKETPGASWKNRDSILRLMAPQYKDWMQTYPQSAALPLALGVSFANVESPDARPYLLKAAKIDSANPETWYALALDAERWGDKKGALTYTKKAADAAPNDPEYVFYDAMNLRSVNYNLWKQKMYALAKRFPESERGAQGLYWLANKTKDTAERIAIYEKLRELYPPESFSWSASGMQDLFALFLKEQPQKAKKISASLKDKRRWPQLDSIAASVIDAHKLIMEGKPKDAMYIIDQMQLPSYPDLSFIKTSLYAKAAARAGFPDSSYNKLVRLYAEVPSRDLMSEIKVYAKQIGYDSQRIKTDIHAIRYQSAKVAADFNLDMYTTSGVAKLKDFKGKVILLTFWFPGCGPCRGEFPHFQNVIDQYREKPVAYVGININPAQDPFVLPFLKGTGYTFIPLKGNGDWAWDHYQVQGAPTNFLIDTSGKIVFSDFRIDGDNEETLALMIEELLAEA